MNMENILNSKYGGLAVVGTVLLAGLGITEYFSSVNKGMDNSYSMGVNVDGKGSMNFTAPGVSGQPQAAEDTDNKQQ